MGMVKFFNLFGKKTAKRYTVDFGKGKDSIPTDEKTVSLKTYLSSDPDLAANVRRFVDNVMIECPVVISKSGEKIAVSTVKGYNEQLKDVRFYKLMRAALYHLIWNGNAFFEVKFSGKNLKEMYVIDPESMRIKKSVDGKTVIGYEQEVNGSPVAKFAPEEIVHISIDHLDSGVWGNAFIKSLQETLVRKDIAESYLQWLIQNDKFAPIINVKAEDMNESQWAHIVSQINARAIDPNYHQIINSFPEDDIELLRLFNTSDFEAIERYIDKQKMEIITLLQVPPIIAGNVDNSNRSNSEIQARLVFFNTIKAFQNIIIEELNYELLRKLKWDKVQFKFNAVDKRDDVETIKIAKSLKQDLHFSDEAILEYLEENGFKIPKVEQIFEEFPEMETNSEGGNPDRPSREARDKTGIPQNEAMRKEDKQMGVSSNDN